MASCQKCGNRKVPWRSDGRRYCKRCGALPNKKLSPQVSVPGNPYGSCFDAAAHNLLANIDAVDGLTMCHGIGIANKPGEEGLTIAHAWLEFNHSECGRIAFDPIWLVAKDADHYRSSLQASLIITYTPKEFLSLWARHYYPGPYDERVLKHTKDHREAAA